MQNSKKPGDTATGVGSVEDRRPFFYSEGRSAYRIKILTLARRFAEVGGGFKKLHDGLALLLGGSLSFSQQSDADLLLSRRRPGGEDGIDGAVYTLHCFSPF